MKNLHPLLAASSVALCLAGATAASAHKAAVVQAPVPAPITPVTTTVFAYQGTQYNAVMTDKSPHFPAVSPGSIFGTIALPVASDYTGSFMASNLGGSTPLAKTRDIYGDLLISGAVTPTTDAFVMSSGEGFDLTDQNSSYFISMEFAKGAVTGWIFDAWNSSGQYISSFYNLGTGNIKSFLELTDQTYNGVPNEATTPGVWHTLADPTKAAAAPPESFRMLQMSLPAPYVGGVPEPAAWSLMLLGVGGLGVRLRQKRRAVAA